MNKEEEGGLEGVEASQARSEVMKMGDDGRSELWWNC